MSARLCGPASLWLRHAAVTVSVAALAIVLRTAPGSGSAQFHTLTEAIATVIAAVVGTLAILRYRSRHDGLHLMLGTGFLGTALLDGYHTIVTSDAFDQFFPSAAEALIPWSWWASRLFLAVSMVLACWVWRREATAATWISERLVYTLGGLLTVLFFLVFALLPLPPAYFRTLPFGRPEEFIPGALFGAAYVGFVRRRDRFRDPMELSLTDSLLIATLAQLLVMARSFALFDAMFDLAHLLKIAGYGAVLVGMLASIHRLFLQHEQAARQLATKNAELSRANRLLARRAEELKEANALLQRRNEELDQFAYIVSHDLKAPLRAIISLATWLNEDYAQTLDADGREKLQLMVDRAQRLSRMIDAILRYSRAGRTRGTPERIDTADLVAEVIASLAPAETIDVRIEGALPVVTYDRTQLRQVFQNLIDNAVKHLHRPHGSVLVSCRDAGDHWRFEVRDTGPGIAPEHRERIFRLFETLRARDEFESTGVGLAIVKRIVERNGGKVFVESAPGRGSCFAFVVPKDDGAAEMSHTTVETVRAGAPT